MHIIKEFKEFAVKGSVIDLAVGVIIGGAFGKIVSSLVADILMPLIGIIIGQINFSSLAWKVGKTTIAYGDFLQSVIDFLIVAFCIFLIVKQINILKKHAKHTPEPAPAEPPADIKLLTEIRDLLKKK